MSSSLCSCDKNVVGEEVFLFKRILLRSFTKACLWLLSTNLEETTKNNQLWTKTNAVTYNERKREHVFVTVQLDYFFSFICPGHDTIPGGRGVNSYMKRLGLLDILLKFLYQGFWSNLRCSRHNATIFSCQSNL